MDSQWRPGHAEFLALHWQCGGVAYRWRGQNFRQRLVLDRLLERALQRIFGRYDWPDHRHARQAGAHCDSEYQRLRLHARWQWRRKPEHVKTQIRWPTGP